MRNDATQKYAKTIFEFSLTYFIGLSNVYNNTAATWNYRRLTFTVYYLPDITSCGYTWRSFTGLERLLDLLMSLKWK